MNRNKVAARVSAFGCGVIVALVLVSRQDLGAAPSATIATCAAADGTLRVTEPNVPCQPEERRVRLQLLGPPDPECKADEGRVERLERRLKDLEARDRRGTMRGRRAFAPFEVITKQDGRLLRIEEENVTFYNHTGKAVVSIATDTAGSLLQTQSASGDRQATIAALDRRAHLVISEQGNDRIDLGRRANGQYSLQVFGPQKKQMVGFGQSTAGSGVAQIADLAGTVKVSTYIMKNDANRAQIEVMNNAGTVVGAMSAGSAAGQLQITDAAGTSMVEAGLTEGNVGVVRTLPGTCHFGVGILGLVPNCIVGKR